MKQKRNAFAQTEHKKRFFKNIRAGARNTKFGNSDWIEQFQILIFFSMHSRQFYFFEIVTVLWLKNSCLMRFRSRKHGIDKK